MGPGRTIPQASKDELVKVAQEFADRLDELYGFHLDIVSGFKANLYRFNKDQPDPPGSDPAELDQRGMTIGRGNPNDPDNVILHQNPRAHTANG